MNCSNSFLKTLLTAGAALALVLGVQVTKASAAILQIQVQALTVNYLGGPSGGTLCDAVSCAGHTGSQAVSEPVINIAFFVDGNLVGQVANGWVDFMTTATQGIPDTPGPVVTPTTGGFFDILTLPGFPGFGLGLTLDGGSITTNAGTGSFIGSASVSNISAQNLPFGLTIGSPVMVAYSMNTFGATSSGGFVTSATATGTAEVRGSVSAVPEPASLVLLGTGLVYGARRLRRRSA